MCVQGQVKGQIHGFLDYSPRRPDYQKQQTLIQAKHFQILEEGTAWVRVEVSS